MAKEYRTLKLEILAETKQFLTDMNKSGKEVETGSLWAVNPYSFIHGFIAWGEGDVLGEKMVPITQPLPEMDDAPPMAKRGWETQVGMSLKCLDGEDKDMEVRLLNLAVTLSTALK